MEEGTGRTRSVTWNWGVACGALYAGAPRESEI